MTFCRALVLALLLSPAPATAQTVFAPVATSEADALAEQVRRLGTNPTDLNALLTAGELSVRLDDLNAAGAFFTRAEKIDPRSGRAKAGEGAILVRSERPGEALRYFAEAERLGLAPARFAGDRGLAYDLLGDPGRAQRDYKLALAAREDSETRRRYALSLGIAGRKAQALDELAPLIRRNDRAAWRSRAFVLAMGGDAAEASRIAQTMMPPGAATGLQSFFAELPRLPAADRAFAVHFGEVRPTPQRLADARAAPIQAPLALDPLPVPVAVAPPAANKRDRKRDRRKDTQLAAVLPTPAPVAAPLLSPPAYQPPVYVPYAASTPVRDRPLTAGEQASLAAAGIRNLPGRVTRPGGAIYTPPTATRALTAAAQANLAAAGARTTAPPVRIASALPVVRPAPAGVTRASAIPTFAPVPTFTAPAPTFGSSVRTSPTLVQAAPLGTGIAAAAPAPSIPVPSAQAVVDVTAQASPTGPGADIRRLAEAVPGFSSLALAPVTSERSSAPVSAAALASADPPALAAANSVSAEGPPAPAAIASAPSVTLAAGTGAPAAFTIAPAPEATLIAGLPSIAGGEAPVAVAAQPIPAPATALEAVAPPLASTPAAVSQPAPARLRPPRSAADAMLARIVAGLTIPATELNVGAGTTAGGAKPPVQRRATRIAVAKDLANVAEPKPAPAAGRRGAKPVADQPALAADRLKPADKKVSAATRKALADKKLAADKKALADKEAAEAQRAERAQPARIWVQVAGGANPAGLNAAWRTMKGKAPAVLNGRQAFTTPLRATNRVLTGPFKTDAEARAYVNQLAKAGVPAFTFTSDKGQKISKLDAK